VVANSDNVGEAKPAIMSTASGDADNDNDGENKEPVVKGH